MKQKLFISYYENGQINEKGYLKNQWKNGTWVKYSYSGNLQGLINYKEGFPDGYYAEFDSDGKIKNEGIYRGGKKSGVEYHFENGRISKKIIWLRTDLFSTKDSISKNRYEAEYDEHGNLRQEGYYSGNKKDSTWNYYDEINRIKATENYKEGKRNGIQTRYYINGKIAEQVEFKEGKMNGMRLQFAENGDTLEFGKYKDDKKNGYCEQKKLLRVADMSKDLQPFSIKGNFTMDKPEGVFELWYPEGKLAARENYREGKLEGKKELFYKNGNLAFRCLYTENKKNGTEEQYYESGKNKCVTDFSNGIITGIQKYFFENGKVSEEIFYESGKVKRLLHYFESGKIRNKINY